MACTKVAALLVLVLAATSGSIQAQRPPTLFILGDSFSDNGNAWEASDNTMPTPAQGYYNGRFSDGPVWSDYIESDFKLEIFNTGYPGATACPPQEANAGLPFFVPYLAQQAEIIGNQSIYNPNSAAFIWMGANDLSGLSVGMLFGQINYTVARSMLPMIAGCIRMSAEGLVKYGITRSMTVSTIQNIGIQPIWDSVAMERTGQTPERRAQILHDIGMLVRELNDMIRAHVEELARMYRRATITTFDMYGLYYSIQRDGPAEGLTNVTDACLDVDGWANPAGAPYNNVTGRCSNPYDYMFWDYSHPSTTTHSFLADRIMDHLATVSNIFLK